MTEIRTSTAVFTNLTKQTLSNAQESLTDVTKQIISGKNTTNYQGILDRSTVNEYLNIKSEATLTGIRSKNNEVLSRKIDTIATVFEGLQTVLRKALTLTQQAGNPALSRDLNIDIAANNYLGSVQSLLNQKSASGQALFSGSRIVSEAVGDLVNVSNLDSIGGVTANYYQGDLVTPTQIISSTQTLSYGILANDPAMQNLIGGLNTLKVAAANTDPIAQTAQINDALNLLNTAKDQLSSLKVIVNSSIKAVDDQINLDQTMLIKIEDSRSSIEDVDISIAFTKLIEMEGKYKIACTLAARAGKFNLADYI